MSARTGGTIDHPARLYTPGEGVCPACGGPVRTYANGRAGSHTPDGRAYTATLLTPPTTCPGWGVQTGPP